MTRVIRFATSGYDASDKDLEAKNLVFSSEYTSPKIYKAVQFTATGQVSHGLDYAPMFWVSCRIPSTYEFEFENDKDLFDGISPWITLTNSILQSTNLGAVEVDETYVYCTSMGISDIVAVHLLIDPADE